ncbi:hypothetical protein C8R46DRAFT_1213564 [Mycena filopes]|nr:hypothetical protein C8R46DRAFT_1213564 [Mycena filopes]
MRLYKTMVVTSHLEALEGYLRPRAIDMKAFISIIEARKSSSFFQKAVRNLFLDRIPPDEVALILSACSGVQNLYLDSWKPHSLLEQLADLPLKHLHCDISHLFEVDQIDFKHRLFANITHLELIDPDAPPSSGWCRIGNGFAFDNERDPEEWSGLAHLPHLTHLAFNDRAFTKIALLLLSKCKSLRVLAILTARPWSGPWCGENREYVEEKELAKDPRFVRLTHFATAEAWQADARRTGVRSWALLDQFVRRRKSNRIPPLEYVLRDDESDSESDSEEEDEDEEIYMYG